MLPLIVVLVCFLVYFLGYKFYSGYISKSVFDLKDNQEDTPAHKLNDGVDYLPTKPIVLFGHHYASIAGLAPVLGPAVAVIWGWLPAMIWVVFGSIFVGCVHDFGAIVVSVRNQGKSIGQVAEDLLGHRARSLFHAIIFFLVALAMGVFVLVLAEMFSADPKAHLKSVSADTVSAPVEEKKISATAVKVTKKVDSTEATQTSDSKTLNEKVHDHPGEIRTEEKPSIRLRSHFPEAVIPSAAIMVFAVIMGYLHYKKGINLTPLTVFSVLATLGSMVLGMQDSVLTWVGLNHVETSPSAGVWKYILLFYAFLASVTPVWLLLQSRDYINSFLLYLGIVLIYLGFFAGGILQNFPSFNTEVIRIESIGLDLIPFVFITIACGAVSGFHALVSSGTTAKQLDKEVDARPIGYGGMIGESLLGLSAVIACTIGFASSEEWSGFYRSWSGIQGLAPQVGAYIYGTGRFLSQIGIPETFGQGFIALIVISFALTSLDSATRLLRYNIEEIAESTRIFWIQTLVGNRYVSSLIACVAIGIFAFMEIEQDGKKKPAGLALWKLFGTTNQLLAGLALLVVTVFLFKSKKNVKVSFIPMLFVLFVTLWAMIRNFLDFLTGPSPNLLLAAIGGTLIVLTLWLLIEAILTWNRIRKV
ncbi:CstA C-terminal domain protein [Leptospira weilii str. 2006001853]|uniref:CstA C-terminal domain protein n=4 Tax=Leptospira weilii TaxID=28184 RepID=A0A828YZ58_9LEPT|nr:carbon starvation protein A [Leptospira weilii]EMM72329.1 CstA C-terminal domain protein [Leptospira weilii str. 2006001855]EKR63499.1 CstA C-terminal domain protein [Leptospira weilii str. 2006001853]EMN46323.1 CstA C-terminal domain protein [Leptospira weilii str. LNT 1234]EMN90243.1 CstA C-terminal domain protein [Leptospira weilii str. UI 13098]QDK24158.1 carbon starvation protein A [Leptospira weilii]